VKRGGVVGAVMMYRPSMAIGVASVDDVSMMAMCEYTTKNTPYFWSCISRQVSGR
jgi:hypothetical protein